MIDLSENTVYELRIWWKTKVDGLLDYKQYPDSFEKFDDKDRALKAYHKVDCAYKILMEYGGEDGDVLLEYSKKERSCLQTGRMIFQCTHCGSTDLEFKMWVNQDMTITDDCEEHPYCNVCEEETRVKV